MFRCLCKIQLFQVTVGKTCRFLVELCKTLKEKRPLILTWMVVRKEPQRIGRQAILNIWRPSNVEGQLENELTP